MIESFSDSMQASAAPSVSGKVSSSSSHDGLSPLGIGFVGLPLSSRSTSPPAWNMAELSKVVVS